MLKGIDPPADAGAASVLRAMGHDDEIAIVDATYPAASAGSKILRLAGVFATAALDAVLSVMPLDDFDATAVWCEVVVGAPDAEEPIFEEFRSIIRRHEGAAVATGKLERARFYDRARAATAIVVTGEGRLYDNLILRKGVVRLASQG